MNTTSKARTPDFFDKDHQLVYRGQFDDSRPSNDIAVTGQDLRTAVDAVLAERSIFLERTFLCCNSLLLLFYRWLFIVFTLTDLREYPELFTLLLEAADCRT